MGDLMSGATVRGRRPPTFAMDLQGLRVLISTDPPDHTLLRRLVSKGFAPRSIAALRTPHPTIGRCHGQRARRRRGGC